MSDLFIGEMLVLVLLIPVLLRPLFRGLQGVEGIALLPLVSFALGLLVAAGSGLRVSFLPAFLFSFLVFLSELARFLRLLRGLPTDWYSAASTIYRCFLLVLLALVFAASVKFAPEVAWAGKTPVRRTTSAERVAAGISARWTFWEPADGTVPADPADAQPAVQPASRGVVLFMGDRRAFPASRSTAMRLLAGSGWSVMEGSFSGFSLYRSALLSPPSVRAFIFFCDSVAGSGAGGSPETKPGSAGNGSDPDDSVAALEFRLLVSRARATYGNAAPLFVVAEGSACAAPISALSADPGLFAGVVCLLPAGQSLPAGTVPGGAILVLPETDALPPDAGSYPVCALTAERNQLYGLGEIRADDVLAAALLGSNRDAGRKDAERTARRIGSWLDARRKYDIR